MASAYGYRMGSRRLLAVGLIMLLPTAAFGFLMGFPLLPAAFTAVIKGAFIFSLISSIACLAFSWMLKSVSCKKACKELVLSRTQFRPKKNWNERLKQKFGVGKRHDRAPPLVGYQTNPFDRPFEATPSRYSRV